MASDQLTQTIRPQTAHLESKVREPHSVDATAEAPRQSTCPACGHHVAVPFMDHEIQPLATLAWPQSQGEAQQMPRLPLTFVRCVGCGHVYNGEFDYAQVPYSDKPNLMFNKGTIWSAHLAWVCRILLEHLPDEPVVVEIGCGDGHLLRGLAQARPAGRYVGFDPNTLMDTTGGSFEAVALLFDPAKHLTQYEPDMIVSRHVLEHLVNPLGFLQSLAFAASQAGHETRLFIEVPCIDRVFETGRTVDFYYEHNSHFTTSSFTRMLQRGASDVESIVHSYNKEVICGIARLGHNREGINHAGAAQLFRRNARRALVRIGQQLDELHHSGRCVAIWGGTGKAAAFMNHYGVDTDRFPLVVDSDLDKVGTFVPGTGQKVRFRDDLKHHHPDVILIPMQWRAQDVLAEMRREGITCQQVLVEHQGELVDFAEDGHPY